MSSTDILLRPRPHARYAGVLLLVPLLPQRKPLKPLPVEVWAEIFAYVLSNGSSEGVSWLWSVAEVCKPFHEIALPLLYSTVRFKQITNFGKFFLRLHDADQKWDSIRRIPYSTPGRWVHSLDISELAFEGVAMALQLDSLLKRLFPLTPFLSTLSLNTAFVLSRKALSSLAQREGAINIRSLVGITYYPPLSSIADEDSIVLLLRSCPQIEELAVVGQELDPTKVELISTGLDSQSSMASKLAFKPLHLPRLRSLSLLSMYSSPLLQALMNSPLPALEKLEITPYDDIPYPASLSTEFIAIHGKSLHSLRLYTPRSWPIRLRPSPEKLLAYCPNLNYLSCEFPLPNLTLSENHCLRILSIPRPTTEFWMVLEQILPMLPKLILIRIRTVRWMRQDVSSMAQEAGIQGQMNEWKRRLERRGIQLLDADWK